MLDNEILVSTDIELLDVFFIHDFLTKTYWAKTRTPIETQTCINHSLNFGLYLNKTQIGYARVVTDYTVFAYLLDVIINESHQRKGFGSLLIKHVLEHPSLSKVKVWKLSTSDAHYLYTKFGFKAISHPEKMMELFRD
jgi:GNAT superfamily N-acetyltransferase